jgi:dTDP-glucose pyrophosphorylase
MEKTIATVIIPAAGAATRLRLITNNSSKIMVPINGKPFLEHLLENIDKYVDTNNPLTRIIIVEGNNTDISDYLPRLNRSNVFVAKQTDLSGPLNAIKDGIKAAGITNIPLLVWLGDTLCDFEPNWSEDFVVAAGSSYKIDDQSQWCVYDRKKYYNKPQERISGAYPLVGVYYFTNGAKASLAFANTNGYDISEVLQLFNMEICFADEWHDIGDIPNYHKTCGLLLNKKARHFNNLKYIPELNVIKKTSVGQSLDGERFWYQNLSPEQRCFTPHFINKENEIWLSYESGMLLSDIFLNIDLPKTTIDYLLNKVLLTMSKYFWHNSINTKEANISWNVAKQNEYLWGKKTIERLAYLRENDILSKEEVDYCLNLAQYLKQCVNKGNYIHGDLHGGNIIYNQYTDSIKLIDPRGQFGNQLMVEGNSLYDIAKLLHDFVLGYGAIVAGRHHYPEPTRTILFDYFRSNLAKDYYTDALKMAGLLTVTCAPCHADNPDRVLKLVERGLQYV